MDDGESNGEHGIDSFIIQFTTYEDYLDRQITPVDMFYLEDIELARQLKLKNKPKQLASAGKHCEGFPLLQALQQREESVRSGKLSTIIFIRDRNSRGQEVSGYIDYGHRLKTENLEPVDTQTSTSVPTQNFQVIADNEAGLLFKNKRDRKIINVDPRARPGDNSTRIEMATSEYIQVVIYDHVTRRRG
eukprot:jgi/Chlat1/5339/Chrsp35S05275